jgi:hypothetical protein
MFSMLVVGFFGALALVLAAVGIYGIIAYSANQRTREIAIRIALGARRGKVFGMVLCQGLRLAALGILFGVLTALLVGRVPAGSLYGVSASDPLTLGCVALLITVVAWQPASCRLAARPQSLRWRLCGAIETSDQSMLASTGFMFRRPSTSTRSPMRTLSVRNTHRRPFNLPGSERVTGNPEVI